MINVTDEIKCSRCNGEFYIKYFDEYGYSCNCGNSVSYLIDEKLIEEYYEELEYLTLEEEQYLKDLEEEEKSKYVECSNCGNDIEVDEIYTQCKECNIVTIFDELKFRKIYVFESIMLEDNEYVKNHENYMLFYDEGKNNE